MNSRYFACREALRYVNAGYRWAYWELEHSGIVELGKLVEIEALLDCHSYWSPPQEAKTRWLTQDVLPAVRSFIQAHRAQEILYLEEDQIIEEEELGHEWIEVPSNSARAAT